MDNEAVSSTEVRICDRPIFIVGSPRSGTTALARALAHHDDLWCSAESDILYYLFGGGRAMAAYNQCTNAPGERWFKNEAVSAAEYMRALGVGINELYFRRSGGKRWIDQTPLYTLMLEELSAMFPQALFIHLLRDGRRVVHSMVNFKSSPGVCGAGIETQLIGEWSSDFRKACRAWQRHARLGTEFCSRYPRRGLTVVNEDIIADPKREMSRIFEFTGIESNSSVARWIAGNRVNSSFHTDSTDPKVVGRMATPWENWSKEQNQIFFEEAGQTYARCGFAPAEKLEAKADKCPEPPAPATPLIATAMLSANPNPAPGGTTLATSQISWDTGDGKPGQVYVSWEGEKEQLFAEAVRGKLPAPWIGDGMYQFRLYSGTSRAKLLQTLDVVRELFSPSEMGS